MLTRLASKIVAKHKATSLNHVATPHHKHSDQLATVFALVHTPSTAGSHANA